EQPGKLYKDDAASSINNLRTQVLMQKADVVIALFGEKYKQWNTAMDASAAITMNKPTIIVRPESLIHPLKELSNKANVTVETIDQSIEIMSYIYEKNITSSGKSADCFMPNIPIGRAIIEQCVRTCRAWICVHLGKYQRPLLDGGRLLFLYNCP